jgi:SAM-dependent methyltransferase
MSLVEQWEWHYRRPPVWDTGRPCCEMQRVLAEHGVEPCRIIELGCGTGANAVWLARQGFEVTGVDLNPRAVSQARRHAASAGVKARFVAAELHDDWRFGGPFDLLVDIGCQSAVRRVDRPGYLRACEHLLRPGGRAFLLAGHAQEPEDEGGPPIIREATLCEEFRRLFEVIQLRSAHFHEARGSERRHGAWSCLLRRSP